MHKQVTRSCAYHTPSEIKSFAIVCSVPVSVEFMAVVTTAAVVVVLLATVLVWTEALINMLGEGFVVTTVNVRVAALLTDVEISL